MGTRMHLHTRKELNNIAWGSLPLRQPLAAGTADFAVQMHINACCCIINKLPWWSKRGCFSHLKNNFFIVMMVHNDTVLSEFMY